MPQRVDGTLTTATRRAGERAGRFLAPAQSGGKEVPGEVQEGQRPACAVRSTADCLKARGVPEKGRNADASIPQRQTRKRGSTWTLLRETGAAALELGAIAAKHALGQLS
jgi:hypothetical protein